jgi:hypothetical protein
MSAHRLHLVSLVILAAISGDGARCVAEVLQDQGKGTLPWTVTLIDGETKEPLSGFDVEAIVPVPGETESKLMVLTSDEAGRFKIPLAAGQVATVYVRETGWWTHSMNLVGEFDWDGDGKYDGPKRLEEHLIPMWRGTVVKGKLLTPEGEPAADVALNVGVYLNDQIWLERMGIKDDGTHVSYTRSDWPNWHTWAKTSDDGTFSVTVPPQDARSWVRIGTGGLGYQAIDTKAIAATQKDHALVRYAPFEVDGNDEDRQELFQESDGVLDFGTLRFEAGVVLKGRVVDAAGRPLAGIHLMTSGPHGPYAGRTTVSRADGSYEFLPMNPGTLTLEPDARPRDKTGRTTSEVVRAMFRPQKVTLGESGDVVELTVQATRE